MVQPETEFVHTGRASPAELEALVSFSLGDPLLKVVLQAVNGFALVLNYQRQVVAANQEALDALQITDPACFAGLRPGELLNCVHYPEGPGGCGTGPHCRVCGALLTILSAQMSGVPAEGECRLMISHDEEPAAVDFKIRVTPINLNGHALLICVFQDISSAKRREVLEQVFLHDFLDAVGGLEGWSRLLKGQTIEDAANEVLALSTYLRDEVLFQRMLMQAEKGQLVANFTSCTVLEIFDNLKTVFQVHPCAKGKSLEFVLPEAPGMLWTDRALLVRVLINMIKNALEATRPAGKVQVFFENSGSGPIFRVCNATYILPEDQLRIFHRSFSTKGSGRGVGTYSMKLFGEEYLHGSVGFVTDKEKGTEFFIQLTEMGDENIMFVKPETMVDQLFEAETEKNNIPFVLLVEDEEGQALLSRLLLERLGYRVQVATNGLEALEIFKTSPVPFRFVITDLTMEKMDGLELARCLLALDPTIPILVCTGLDEPHIQREARQIGIRQVSLKPVSVQELEDLLINTGLYQPKDD
jgi:CheY-like chemotaxis protein